MRDNLISGLSAGGQSYRLLVKCEHCAKDNYVLVEEEWDTNAMIVDEVCEHCGKEFTDKSLAKGEYIEYG